MKGKSLDSSKDILNRLKAEKAKPINKDQPATGKYFAELWRQGVPKYNSALVPFMPVLTMKQIGQLGHLSKKLGANGSGLLLYVIQHWIAYAKHVQEAAGLKVIPKAPNIDFLLKYANEAKGFYARELKSLAPQKSAANFTVADLPEPMMKMAMSAGVPPGMQVVGVKGAKIADEEKEATLEEIIEIGKKLKFNQGK